MRAARDSAEPESLAGQRPRLAR